MKLGISSYSYGWAVGFDGAQPEAPLSPFDLLQKAESFGVRVLQIGDNLPLDRLSSAERQQFAGLARDKGIGLEVGTRGFTPKIIETYVEIASMLGSPILRIVTDMRDYEPSKDRIIGIAKEMAPVLERHGVILAIENHDRFRVKELAGIIDRVGSPYLGICLDTVNSIGAAEGLETVVDVLGPYTVNFHVKDFSIRRFEHLMGFKVEGQPAGKGFLNVPWVLEKLQGFGRTPNVILELWTPPEASLPETVAKEARWVEESVAYLRTIVKE